MSDSFGREHLSAAWGNVFGDSPAPWQIQTVQAVARLESGYGRGVYRNLQTGETAVLNNWGAVQCKHGTPCDGVSCWEATDTHGPEWQAKHPGEDPHYQWCYRRFSTPAEGASDFLATIRRIVDRSSLGFFGALATRSTDAFVRSMREGGYFEARLEKYQEGVWTGVQKIASNLGEDLAVTKEEGSLPVAFEDDGATEEGAERPLSSGSQGMGSSPMPSDSGPSNDPEADELYEPENDSGCD